MASSSPTAPIPPAPGPPTVGIRTLFALRDVRRRSPFALRAAVCTGVPVFVGWAAGDLAAGLMASIGGFTSLYGGGRPYLNRALELFLVALTFGAAVSIGLYAATSVVLGVVAVAAIATAATLVANSVSLGPPGAYMFTLSCAVGTGMGAAHLSPLQTGLLVFAGGMFAWLVHMSGALIAVRGPEKSAVAAAATAVATFIDSIGTPAQDAARHVAATAMHQSWTTLVALQPVNPRPDSTLSRLRTVNRDLHLVLAEAMRIAAAGATPPPELAGATRRLGAQARDPAAIPSTDDDQALPLGRPGARALLRQAVSPGSPYLAVAARVGIAALVAGALGAALSLEHAYWAITAAVLMLHQGADWVRTLQRSLERTVGTWLGLVLAALILTHVPHGLWMVPTIMALQFTVEMLVVRNYALAVIFITPAALTISTGGRPVGSVSTLVLARGVDTVIGCAVALVVYLLTTRWSRRAHLHQALVDTLQAVAAVAPHLARGAVTTPEALAARQHLQLRTMALLPTYDAAVGGTIRRREEAERLWPAVVAIQRLAYRTIAACWSLEAVDGGAPAAAEVARSLLDPASEHALQATLADLADSVRDVRPPEPLGPVPQHLAPELTAVRESLLL